MIYQTKMDDQIKQLAETLRKQGLAASEYEAAEKAKSILNVKTQRTDSQDASEQNPEQNVEDKRPMPNLGVDVKDENAPLNNLMKEVNVSPEEIEAQEQEKLDNAQEKIDDIKEDIKEVDKSPEQVEQVKEGIAQVKDEVNKIYLAENESEEKKQDMFEDEEKIDLTKLFNKNKNTSG